MVDMGIESFHSILNCGSKYSPVKFIIMDCILIERRTYNDLHAHIQQLLERVSALYALSAKPHPVRWMTIEEVCKALSITKRALQYYRSSGIIPYTTIGNKVLFREEDVCRLLERNMIKSE